METIVEGEYTKDIYDDGHTERYLTGHPPQIVQPPILTEMERATYETAANMEMLVALKELELGLV